MLLICVHYNWINIWDEQIKMQRRKLRSDRNLLYRWKSHLAGLAVRRKIFSFSPYTSHREKFETNTKLIKIISSLTYWSLIMAFWPKRSPTMLNINCKLKRKKYFVKFNFINFFPVQISRRERNLAKGRKSRLDTGLMKFFASLERVSRVQKIKLVNSLCSLAAHSREHCFRTVGANWIFIGVKNCIFSVKYSHGEGGMQPLRRHYWRRIKRISRYVHFL